MNDQPYLLRGSRAVETESSVLVSSSRWLNEPRLRDWVATHMLRKSGKDIPTSSDAFKLHMILSEIQDLERIEALFSLERQRWPELDRWFSERHISTFTKQDLLDCPPGSVGRTFGDYVVANNFELDIVARYEPKTQYDYYRFRSGQTHDLEHIITGGNFDILGELVPYYARLTNVPRFLTPELAAEVNVGQLLGATRLLMRTGLHYPEAYLKALEATRAGMRVGLASAPIFMFKFEDVLALSIAEAREALGVRDVAPVVDTSAESLVWDEYR